MLARKRLLLTNLGSVAKPGLPITGNLVFTAQGNTGFPTYANGNGFQVTSGYEFLLTETWLPAQASGARFIWCNDWGITNGIPPIENKPANDSALAWGSVLTTFSGAALVADVTYATYGLALSAGSFTISDALPAISDGYVARHVISTALSGFRFSGYNFTAIGEGQRKNATQGALDAIRSSGAASSAGSAVFNNEAAQMAGIVAPMAANYKSALCIGTSIERGQDANYRDLLSPGYASGITQGTFTGVVTAAGVLTVSSYAASNGGVIGIGTYVPEITAYVIGKGTGTGGNGTYTVSVLAAVGSSSMTAKGGRNTYSYLAVGFDNPTNNRVGWWQANINGASLAQQDEITQGELLYRYSILLGVARLNGNKWPMNMGVLGFRNDFIGINGTDATDTFNQWVAFAAAKVAVFKALFPGLPWWIVDMPPMQAASAFSPWFYTDTANQTPSAGNYRSGAVALFNAYVATAPGKAALGIAGVIAAGSAACAPDDGSGLAKWAISPFNLAGGGTLDVADYPAGLASGTNISTTGVTVTATVPPEIGNYLVFEPGVANSEGVGVSGSQFASRTQIISVVSTGTNKWLCKTATGTTTKLHAAGSVVKTSQTQDGTHPSHYAQQIPMAAAVVTAKAGF